MTYSHAFSRAWHGRHVFASSSDWFIGLFTTVVIGQSNTLVLVLRHSNQNRSISEILSVLKTVSPKNIAHFLAQDFRHFLRVRLVGVLLFTP